MRVCEREVGCVSVCVCVSWLWHRYSSLDCLDFHEYLSFNESRTRSHRLSLRPTGSRINSFRYSFFINIPFLWNTLPVDILDATSLSTFKSKLKNFLS